jgi:phosphoglucomutase
MSHNIIKITDFSKDTVTDADGRRIPPQKFFFIELDSGIKFAVRASVTEPKIKFYLFAEKPVQSHSELDQIKHETSSILGDVKSFLLEDANKRAVQNI